MTKSTPAPHRNGLRRLLQDRRTVVTITAEHDGQVGWLAEDGTTGSTPACIFFKVTTRAA
jgi:hypothetical protein